MDWEQFPKKNDEKTIESGSIMGKTCTKVMKYQLRYDGDDFYEMQKLLWNLQKQTRQLLNKTTRIAYLSKDPHGKTDNSFDMMGNKLGKYVYHRLKEECYDFSSDNYGATINKALEKYNSLKKEIENGNVSLPSYKKDQPLIIRASAVKLLERDGQPIVDLRMFSKEVKKVYGSQRIEFSVLAYDGTQKAILRRVMDGEYKLGECQMVYEKKKWFLIQTYTFSLHERELDPEKILGVDLGETYAIFASSVSSRGVFKIEGGEVTAYAKKLESQKKSLQKQAAHCGEGRIGHGTKTRVSNVYRSANKIENYRNTINHRYSKALVEYAVKNGFGVIQMEDLSGIQENTGHPKMLRHWTYYDLQSKIEAKAKENGIAVRKINPQYTSQRCSKCGHIDAENRKTQESFRCTSCGFSCNADYNASQNISIKNIDKIIKKHRANGK